MIEKASDFVLFAKVVEAGGFTAASKLIHIPQASISRRIADLEDALDVRLLERSTRKVSITDAGARVYEHAKKIVEEMESAQAIAESLHEKPSGVIRLTAPVILGQYILAKLIADFCSLYPDVSFQVELTGRRVDLIEEGFDLAIRVGDLNVSSLIKMPLVEAKQAYYASEEVAKRVTDFNAFKDENWLSAASDFSLTKWNLRNEDTGSLDAVFEKKPLIVSNDIEVLIRGAQNGIGIAILPEFTAANLLSRVLPGYMARNVEINALVVSRKSIIPAIRLFVEFLRENLPDTLEAGVIRK